MATKLTDKFADAATCPPGKRDYHIEWDTEVKGFGLRVTKAGAKSFILNYRTFDGFPRRPTIGTFRDPWRTTTARKEASRLKALIDQGRDPLAERRERRAAPVVRDLIERWRTDHAPRLRPRNRVENERLARQWIEPALGGVKVDRLTYADIDRLHRRITAAGTPYRANRVIAMLSKMLSLSIRWGWRSDNPCRSVERNPEHPRHRYLDNEEIRRLLAGLADHPDQRAANAVWLLLSTGARSGEVLNAAWPQFDLTTGVWTKPAASVKQDREHRLPLSSAVVELLTLLPRTGVALFPGLRSLRPHWKAICGKARIDNCRLHDLRHTHASFAGQLGHVAAGHRRIARPHAAGDDGAVFAFAR
jgi:integrase